MSKREHPNIDKENEELRRLREGISELEKDVNINYYWEMLKVWLISIAIVSGITGLVFIVIFFARIPKPLPSEIIDPAKVEDISKVIFTATITVNGIVMGFVPLTSFFFAREIAEHQHGLLELWETENKESEGEKLNLIRYYYNLLLASMNNLRSGVLRYARTYIIISVFLLLFLMTSYVVWVIQELVPLFLLVDIIFLAITFQGILPVINIALYQPVLRFVRYDIMEKKGEIVKIEFED